MRPANFIPIGVSGSTEEIAQEIGFRQDLDKAKELLAKAGFPTASSSRSSTATPRSRASTYQ